MEPDRPTPPLKSWRGPVLQLRRSRRCLLGARSQRHAYSCECACQGLPIPSGARVRQPRTAGGPSALDCNA